MSDDDDVFEVARRQQPYFDSIKRLIYLINREMEQDRADSDLIAAPADPGASDDGPSHGP
jgi:hypothetical protein